MSNIITAKFAAGSDWCRVAGLWQYDYGQVLAIDGLTLPDAFEVHFAHADSSTTKTVIGADNQVAIPDEYLRSGTTIHAYIYLHAGDNDGETEYKIMIPVKMRPVPTDYAPTPQEQSVITQTIAALGDGVKRAETAATAAEQAASGINQTITDALTEAKASGEFKGEKGDKGNPGDTGATGDTGPAGYTPQRGVDYWTDEDKAAVEQAAKENIEQTVSDALAAAKAS